ncbi:kinase-like protein [Neolentinus lepideus HHB14362 ss-1]|uniref:Kinase-like protein n=1 Tax=Neolentinus lepideus HHB14362 ss-1 TaxID=1314782 RepID=A0A165PQ88_9AGAM|nr:kinase-like protein [Neolentinus lepideus HHB14362 ss-1]
MLPSGFLIDVQALQTADVIRRTGGFGIIEKMAYAGLVVAVKKTKGESVDEKQKKMFRREALLWRQLYHNNVVRLYGILWPDQSEAPSLVLPWMEDGDIRAYIATRSPSLSEIYKWLLDIACGLYNLHQNEIIHADLRGKNVLVHVDSTGNRVAQITDFGLSRFLATDSAAAQIPSKQSKSEWPGNYHWLAPEVIRSDAHTHTKASDIWSYGWVCWEISTGMDPLEGVPHGKVLDELTKTPHYRATTAVEERLAGRKLPESLRPLMDVCWDRRPECRPDAGYVWRKLSPMP